MRVLQRFPAGGVVVSVVGALACGCFVLPLAAPPMRVTGSYGAAVGAIPVRVPAPDSADPPRAERRVTSSVATIRAALHPLQAVDDVAERRFDFGLGYGAARVSPEGAPSITFQGPYLEVGWLFWRRRADDHGAARLRASVAVDLLMADLAPDRALGGGATAAVALEFVGFARDSFSGFAQGGGALGGTCGEGGMGVQLSGSVYVIDGTAFTSITLGLSASIPAFAALIGGIASPRGLLP